MIFAEFSSTGGTRSFLKDLIFLHEKHNISTEIVFPKSASDNDIVHYIESRNFSYTLVPDRKAIFKKSYFSLVYELYYYYRIISKVQPDLIIVSTSTPGENIFCFLSRIPSIYILHTPANKSTLKNAFMFKIPSIFCSQTKRIYAVSDYVKQSILKFWNIPSQYVSVIYNSYRLDPTILVNKPVEPKIVLTLGHVTEYKNPLLWLKIAKEVTSVKKDVEFLWLGEGDMLDQLQGLTKNLRNINFVGHKDNIRDYYQKAYLYLQPSLKESLGISVLDAMSIGIPAIVSNVEGLPETTEHGVSGYICDSNESAKFTMYLISLLSDDKLRDRMSLESKKRAYLLFNPNLQWKKISHLYYSITRNL
jgi:glycosyltransferase involved in cell wall biosynthesis